MVSTASTNIPRRTRPKRRSMKNVIFPIMHVGALSLALFGIVGCAVDENDPKSASEEVSSTVADEMASDMLPSHLDSERAAASDKARRAIIGIATITPSAASCGRAGDTSS